MPDEIVLYKAEDDEEEDIVANPSAGYDVMMDQVRKDGENLDYDPDQRMARMVEETVHQSIKQMAEGKQINKAYATLFRELQKTGEIDIDSIVENVIHAMAQESKDSENTNGT